MTVTTGVIFATTGKNYTELAERAALSVKENCPELSIDLFTDQPVVMHVFDRIHQLENPHRRSKIDAMILSRFDKTLYLDADLFVIADIRDVFEVLDHFDMAIAQDQARNKKHCHTMWQKTLPNAFPQFNSGVVAFKKNHEVIDLLKRWSTAVRENNLNIDQPVLRELIWDGEVKVATLPQEYNLMRFDILYVWDEKRDAAPRIIHSPRFHQHFTMSKRRIDSVEGLVGPAVASKLPIMLSSDKGLARMAGREPYFPNRRKRKVLKWLRPIRDMRRRWLGF